MFRALIKNYFSLDIFIQRLINVEIELEKLKRQVNENHPENLNNQQKVIKKPKEKKLKPKDLDTIQPEKIEIDNVYIDKLESHNYIGANEIQPDNLLKMEKEINSTNEGMKDVKIDLAQLPKIKFSIRGK